MSCCFFFQRHTLFSHNEIISMQSNWKILSTRYSENNNDLLDKSHCQCNISICFWFRFIEVIDHKNHCFEHRCNDKNGDDSEKAFTNHRKRVGKMLEKMLAIDWSNNFQAFYFMVGYLYVGLNSMHWNNNICS